MIERYVCTKCGKHPNSESEVLRGCLSCGNSLFRLVEKKQPTHVHTSSCPPKGQVGNIEVDGEGIFRIDVGGLFEGSGTNVLSVQGSDGIVHIRF